MQNGLRYESGRDMPPGMQIAAAKAFLCSEAGAMLAALQVADTACMFCVNNRKTNCLGADITPENWCTECLYTGCACYGCADKSKYHWCGAEEAMRRLAAMDQK